MRIAPLLLLFFATLALVTCSSDTDDADRRPQSYPRGAGGARRGGIAGTTAADGLEMMPPSDWWRDPQISAAVNLTNDQLAALDRISHDQSEEIAKLDRDSMTAVRDFREILDSSQPSAADITGAGQRLRGIRDALFDRRVQMFAAERTLLTQQQWNALQQQLSASRNREDRGDRGGSRRGRGGRGGMGGRGRFPG